MTDCTCESEFPANCGGECGCFHHDAVRLAATPAPRENGWEELRREIEALPCLLSGEVGCTGEGPHDVNLSAVLAIVDRLAVARGEPGLDVERLARAMTTVYEEDLFPIKSGDWRYDASLIAAEYLRLVDEPKPEPRRLGCSVAVLAFLVLLSSLVVPVTAATGRSGVWAYAKASYGPAYLAIPEGPGWHVTVCGPKGCLDRVSTDAGPELWLQRAGRIGDLAAVMFVEICGPLSAGLCAGSYTITGRADQHPDDPPEHPDDARMRAEDQMTLPPTSTVDAP